LTKNKHFQTQTNKLTHRCLIAAFDQKDINIHKNLPYVAKVNIILQHDYLSQYITKISNILTPDHLSGVLLQGFFSSQIT
jgi:predicted phosphohydrolase